MKFIRFWILATVGTGMLVALGCQGLMNQEAAVQKAIQDHLAARSDLAMDQMTMVMERVTVNGDTAQADVVFAVPGDPQSRMSFQYDLHREGGRWLVDTGRPSVSEAPHPQMGESPTEGSPSGGSMSGEPGSAQPLNLPEDHPPLGMMPPPSTGP